MALREVTCHVIAHSFQLNEVLTVVTQKRVLYSQKLLSTSFSNNSRGIVSWADIRGFSQDRNGGREARGSMAASKAPIGIDGMFRASAGSACMTA